MRTRDVRAALLFQKRQHLLAAAIRLYDSANAELMEAHQVERFNRAWNRCLREIPFYQAWAREHHLPHAIAKTEDLLDFPILTRGVIVQKTEEIFEAGRLTRAISTGGSTGVPARFPTGPQDSDGNWVNTYLARRWWGIAPFDRQLLIWGHSHLFGEGMRRHVALVTRAVSDRLINARRIDAYDMSPEALSRYASILSQEKPAFVVGYTSALFRLARHIEQSGIDPEIRSIKGVILTAETVSRADIELISKVFCSSSIIEYGAAETGVIAYSRPGSDPLRVHLLWDSYIGINDGGDILITTIGDRTFPLINYRIGDRTIPATPGRRTVTEFDAIAGREKDFVRLNTVDGRELVLSAIMLVHILKQNTSVRSVSFQQARRNLTIFVEGDAALDVNELSEFFIRQMKRDHPSYDPNSVALTKTSKQFMTVAGKHVLMRPPLE